MSASKLPFNVSILQLTPDQLKTMRPVTVLDFFENASGDFHDDGLFSVPIFGRVGSEDRDRRFSYIDLKTQVLHPIIYERLCQLKNLYRGILAGTHFAVWDDELKDFKPSNELDGDTGYSFFLRHWKDIRFIRNNSDIREQRIRLVEKYRDIGVTDKILVMPAGLRDIEIDQTERMKVSEHNSAYRKILSIARTIGDVENPNEHPALDLPRRLMGQAFVELYQGIERILTGKKGFIQDKWSSRRIFDGTRNVITAMDHSVEDLQAPNATRFTDTVVGIWQLSRAVLPKTIHYLRTAYLDQIFGFGDMQARLVDPQTLTAEIVTLASDQYDRWATVEGLEKTVVRFKDVTIRDRPIMVGDRYLALIYVGPHPQTGQQSFRVFSDINELPEGFDRKYVRPINLVELLYLSGYRYWNDFVGFVARYPVTGVDSCYATTLYCRTTTVGEVRAELGPDFEPLGDDYVAYEFPVYSDPTSYQDSLVIPSVRLSGLGADFDGDMCSLMVLYTDEAVEEVQRYLSSMDAYVDPLFGLRTSIDVATIGLVLKNMTSVPQ